MNTVTKITRDALDEAKRRFHEDKVISDHEASESINKHLFDCVFEAIHAERERCASLAKEYGFDAVVKIRRGDRLKQENET